MGKNKEKESLGFRLDKELMDKIRVMADKQNRTLSNMVETLLKEQIKKIESNETL